MINLREFCRYIYKGSIYLPVGIGQVQLIANHHDRNVCRVLGIDDLVPDGGSLLERIGIGDGVDQHESVRRRYGQGAHGRKLVRAGSVQYVQVDFHAVHRELAVVHFLHGPLVLGRELSVQELRDQRRLAHPRRAHHHDLVPRHVTRVGRRRWWLQLVMMVVTAFNAATVKTNNFLFTFIIFWGGGGGRGG